MTEPGFRDSRFMTAAMKRRVLAAWRRFLKGGLQEQHFTRALYDHLHLHLPFIANFNKERFYATYFSQGDDTLLFFRAIRDFIAGPMSNLRCPDYDDINQALLAELNVREAELAATARIRQREADLKAVDALLSKHGLAQYAIPR